MTPLQVGLRPGLSPAGPGSLAWSEDQLPKVGRACCLPPALPAASLALPCRRHGARSPTCPPACGSPAAHKAHIFQPVDLPDSAAVTARPGASLLQLQAVAWAHGMEEALEGLPAPKPAAFGCFAGPQHDVPQGQVPPPLTPLTASSISSRPPFGVAHGRASQATASASTAAVSHRSVYIALGQLLAVIDEPSHF